MGKSKPRTRDRARNRNNPAGKLIKPPSDPELAAIREQRILPVLKDLQSAELKTRSAAASAISNIIEDTKCRKLLLREQIVKILFDQTLTDSSLETRTAGWGILTNLALEEEADFCIHLYRQDVITSIEGVVRTIVQTISSQDPQFASVPKAEQNLVWTLTRSIVNLLTSLSEAQEEIVETISAVSSIIHFLFGLLSYELAPAEVQHEALSCLTALTEDNQQLVKNIAENNDWLDGLIHLKDGNGLKAVAACGVLHNIFTCMEWFDHNTEKEGVSDAILIPTLAKALSQDANTINDTTSSNPDQILRLALEITASIATTLQEALEHASGHEKTFEGFDDKIEDDGDDDKMEDDDEDLEEGDEDDEDDGEMNDEEIDADMELVTGHDSGDEDDADEVTLDRLVRSAAPQVLRLACTSSEKPDDGESIQIHALSALNNIAWTVSSIDFSKSHLDSIKTSWSSLAYKIWDEIVSPVLASNTADIELASSVTSLAWAVSRSVQGAVNLKPEEQRKFMALYQASKNLPSVEDQSNGSKQSSNDDSADAFQSLGVKSVGVLGSLARDPAPIELNKEIGVFLLTVLTSIPETQPAVAVEALDQIFDIYADKSYEFDEPVFWGAGFYKHLEEVLPKVKKMAKGIDKRKLEELRSRADEAALNLARFLKYKRTEKQEK